MALPALDAAFADLKDLPQKQILATWLANKTGGAVADVLTLSEKQLWAELAVAYGGNKGVQGYEGIALQYSWAAIYNGITGGTDTHINWGIRQAMEAIVGAQYGVDVCCYTTGFPIQYLLAFMALSAAAPLTILVDILGFFKLGSEYDSSNNGYDCLTSGAPVYAAGKIGESIYRDPEGVSFLVNEFISANNYANWSVSMWIKRSEDNDAQIAFAFGSGTESGSLGVYAGVAHDGGLQILVPSGSVVDFDLAQDEWKHLAITFDGGANFKIYLNGVLVANLDDQSNVTEQYFGVLAGTNGLSNSNGSVDALGVWSRVLSESEVLYMYNNGEGRELF